MTLISKHWPLIPIFLALTACSVFEPAQTSRLCADDNGNFSACTDRIIGSKELKQHTSLFTSELNFVQLGEYTQQIAFDLKRDLPSQGLDGSVIITPFLSTNELIEEADNFGRDLAEYLTNDLRDLGIVTSDQSLASYLYRTKQGNIEFSAKQQEIFSELNASYVLTGKIQQLNNGIMLNAKITELKSGRTVASSAKLLPNILMNNIL